jgi:general stress protein YciG
MTAKKPHDPNAPKSRRGFASMSREKLLEISSKGGSSVPAEKRSFNVDRSLAADAGREGGRTRRTTKEA